MLQIGTFMKNGIKQLLVIGVIVLSVVAITSCKKITFDLTSTEEPEDAPDYTVEFNPNLSPAEGGVRKPTS